MVVLVKHRWSVLRVVYDHIHLVAGSAVAVDYDGGVNSVSFGEVSTQRGDEVLFSNISTLSLMGDALFRQFQLLKQRELLMVERFLKKWISEIRFAPAAGLVFLLIFICPSPSCRSHRPGAFASGRTFDVPSDKFGLTVFCYIA
jgi:hypothetical protein